MLAEVIRCLGPSILLTTMGIDRVSVLATLSLSPSFHTAKWRGQGISCTCCALWERNTEFRETRPFIKDGNYALEGEIFLSSKIISKSAILKIDRVTIFLSQDCLLLKILENIVQNKWFCVQEVQKHKDAWRIVSQLPRTKLLDLDGTKFLFSSLLRLHGPWRPWWLYRGLIAFPSVDTEKVLLIQWLEECGTC